VASSMLLTCILEVCDSNVDGAAILEEEFRVLFPSLEPIAVAVLLTGQTILPSTSSYNSLGADHSTIRHYIF
jgi:hypothetical protein